VIRVATLNLWNKSGPWQARMDLVREEMAALRPDLLALQEVLELHSPKSVMNQADELKGDVYERAYGPAHELSQQWIPASNTLYFGNALLSRWPILEERAYPLPGDDVSDQKRSVLHARVKAPVGPVDVFVTHLNWKLDEGWIRELQVKEIARLVAEHAPDDGRYPPILMGDLNAEPRSDEIRFLGGYTRLGEPRTVRFADAWSYGGGAHEDERDGFTFDARRNDFAAAYHEPPRRVDYVFVRGPDGKGRGRPRRPRLCFHRPRGGVWCSDHFGVTVDLAT